MSSDYVDGVLSDEEKAAVLAALEIVKTKLPFLVDLSPDERRSLPKMGDKSVAFVQAALAVAEQNPNILPPAFNLAAFRKDVALMTTAQPVADKIKQLAELMDDTMVALGTDAYTAALVVYQMAQLAGKGQGLDQLLDAMGQRFARKSKGTAAAKTAAK